MPKYQVQIIEVRELVFEVEAEDEDDAENVAMEADTSEAVRDTFRSREQDWTDLIDA